MEALLDDPLLTHVPITPGAHDKAQLTPQHSPLIKQYAHQGPTLSVPGS